MAIRDETPFDSEQEFIDRLKTDYDVELESGMVSVKSDYFMVSVNAVIGRTDITLYSLLRRDGDQIVTLRRSLGVF